MTILKADFSGNAQREEQEIKILEDLRKLLKPLEEAELKTLEESLLEEGCRDALVTWNGYLVDGHNRLAICKKHGLKYRTAEKDFPNIHRAKIWMIQNQLGRRNIENFMKIALHDLIQRELQKEAKSRQGTRNDLKDKDDIENIPLIQGESGKKRENETNRQLSRLTGIGHNTISKYNKIMSTKDEELISDCMSGKKTINRAYLDLKAEEKASEAEDIGFPTDKDYRYFYCDPYYQTYDKKGSGWAHKDCLVDIEDLPVRDVKFFEAKCFIWTPPYFLTSSLNLMKSWGFEYQTSLCWELTEPYESQTVIGEYLLVLIGTVGGSNRAVFKPNTILRDNGHGSRHDQVRAYIDKMHPEGDRLEILGKQKKEGWDLFSQREEAL